MESIEQWLVQLGLDQYVEAFAENDIDWDVLSELDHALLRQMGVDSIGHRVRILKAAKALHKTRSHPADAPADPRGRAERTSGKAERRQLTVMFCDLVDSTALAERLDPEELRELLADYQDRCARVVSQFEGYIARYVGDGLLIYFGYPQAHEDDARRAVRAGLEIARAVDGLNAGKAPPGIRLAVRVGISTGRVVVGDIGEGERFEEGAVVGATPNLAARLQTLAEPGAVVVGESTKHLVEGLFDADDLGPRRLKGVSEPVRAFRVRAEADAPNRFEAIAEQGLTPLVGREEEIGMLLKRWRQAIEGEGQVVLLSGPAGIGKSRILRSFRERIGGPAHGEILYSCVPYYQRSAFRPVIGQLAQEFGFEKDDAPEVKLGKVASRLLALDLPEHEFTPVLASLLSLPLGSRYETLNLSPEELKKKVLSTLAALIDAMAARAPVLIIVEDAHWIDPSTMDLVVQLSEHLRHSQVLLVLTFRPEFEWSRPGLADATLLTLNRLSRRETTEMIAKAAGGKALPGDMLDEIIARTDGVPLFVEELTKTVVESGLLAEAGDRYEYAGTPQPLDIPVSLQDSLMARLDRLGPAKELAQLAATLGRTFTHSLLASVWPGAGEQLEVALARLIDSQLIHHYSLSPEVTYEFKHALVRDVAYQSLLKSDRKAHHRKVAETLEALFPETAETDPAVLAFHYTEAGLVEKAISYWHRAGQRALEHAADAEAVDHLSEGLRLLETLPDSPRRDEQEIALRIALGPALMHTKGTASKEVEQTYLRTLDLCRRHGRPDQRFAALWGLWFNHHVARRFETARQMANNVVDLAEKLSDSTLLLQGYHASWTTKSMLGDLQEALDHAERGLAIYDMAQHRSSAYCYGGHDAGVCAVTEAILLRWLLGYPDTALARIGQALELAKALAYPFSMAEAQCYTAILYQLRRDPVHVVAHAQDMVDYSAEQQLDVWLTNGQVLLGWGLVMQGETERGIALMRRAIDERRSKGLKLRLGYYLGLYAEALGQAGDGEGALNAAAEGLAVTKDTGELRWQALVQDIQAALMTAASREMHPQAEARLKNAIEVARQQQAKSLELRAARRLAQLWSDKGLHDDARDLLTPVYEWFVEGLDTADLREARALLDRLN